MLRSARNDRPSGYLRLRRRAITAFYLVLCLFAGSAHAKNQYGRPSGANVTDGAFLELVSRKAFDFFWDHQDTKTGLFADNSSSSYSSIAGCGFGLSALCIGAERAWVDRNQAQTRAERLLRTLSTKAVAQQGFFYHFLHRADGSRTGTTQVSTIDNALLLAGVVTAGEYFGGEVRDLANKLYDGMQWDAFVMPDSTAPDRLVMRMAWTPESGFTSTCWDYYSDEAMLICILAIGSRTHPVDPACFYGFKRIRVQDREGRSFIPSWFGALFTYQYAHAWIDFRGTQDRMGVNWWENSRVATLANRAFCIANSQRFKTYSPTQWGITSFYTPREYVMHHGALPNGCGSAVFDGTISPSGPAGSIAFTPQESLESLKALAKRYPRLWGRYGFLDSFNLDEHWIAPRYYALGQGITLLAIENFRSGLVWQILQRNAQIRQALLKAGLR